MEENYTELKNPPSKGFASFFDIFESLVFAIICVVVFFTFFARLSVVDGPSMNPTLKNGEYLIVGNFLGTYKPKNGDIVVVHGNYESFNIEGPIVKRVIATEGQTLKIDYNTISEFNGEKTFKVYIDGELLEEDYINPFTRSALQIFMKNEVKDGIFEIVIPEGKIFVMGDNRDHSTDSRIIGFIDSKLVVGKAIFRILPFNKIGKIK